MVRLAGLEPARLTALPPQSSVSANSTISAAVTNRTVRRTFGKGILNVKDRWVRLSKSSSSKRADLTFSRRVFDRQNLVGIDTFLNGHKDRLTRRRGSQSSLPARRTKGSHCVADRFPRRDGQHQGWFAHRLAAMDHVSL